MPLPRVKRAVLTCLIARNRESKWGDGPWEFEAPAGESCFVIHGDYGLFGRLSLQPVENGTRVRFGGADWPSRLEAVNAFQSVFGEYPEDSFGVVEWASRERAAQNTRLLDEMMRYLHEFVQVEGLAPPEPPAYVRRRGKSGRPNLPEDVWAWEQVNQSRRPLSEVYREWLEREEVRARNLQDAKRQFNRITQPGWRHRKAGKPAGHKSGQNI